MMMNHVLFCSVLSFLSSGTQLVFVPSQRDVHHDFVFPQPPFHPSHLSQLSGEDRQVPFLSVERAHLHSRGPVLVFQTPCMLY